MTQSRFALLAAATATMMALAGCGGGDDAPEGSAQVKVQPQTAQSQEQAKQIGEANAKALAAMSKGGGAPGAPPGQAPR